MFRSSQNYDKLIEPGIPLSEKHSTEEDIKESDQLYQTFLKDKYLSDISDPNHPAKIAFSNATTSLNTLLSKWIDKITTILNLPSETTKKAKVQLVPYGSHRLEVNTIDGDVDALVLAPKFVERDKHFFGELPTILKEDTNISDVQTIRDAFVPLIKFKYQNLSIDLIFASLDTGSLDDKLDKLKDDNILLNMDAEMKRSVNGFRVAEKILESVSNLQNFRTTLKLVKLWAKSKSIYSNSIGYLGGISCAILVAKICQLFPNFMPNKLLMNFFKFYSDWPWENYQVQIAKIQYKTLMPDSQWTPDEKSVMTVITPAFPCMNSTYNVSATTLKIISGHFKEGFDIISRCTTERKPIEWKKVFEKYEFFKNYYHFLEITIGSDSETREPYIKWRSLVESKIRYFTKGFEFFEYHKQLDIRPYPIPFERDTEIFKYCVSYYIGVKPNKDHEHSSGKMNFMAVAKEFLDNLTSFKKKEDKLRILYFKREDLPEIVFDKKEKPKWATKDWVESRRAISSEKSENEENPQAPMANNMQMFSNMTHQVGMQQNNFQPFYAYPPFNTQYMPNNANGQNPGFVPMNYLYQPYQNFQGQQTQGQVQGKNTFPQNNNTGVNIANIRKHGDEGGIHGINENGTVGDMSNNNGMRTSEEGGS